MFRMTVIADTLLELKKKLLQAGESINMLTIDEDAMVAHVGRKQAQGVNPVPTEVPPFTGPPLPYFGTPLQPQLQPIESPRFPIPPNVDGRGFPWDERIHASTKNFGKDGSWKLKRSVDDRLVTQIEQEHIARLKSGQIPEQVPASPTQFAPPAVPGSTQQNVIPFFPQSSHVAPVVQPVVEQRPSAPAYENIPIPQGMKSAHTLDTFKVNFVTVISELINARKIDQDYVQTLKDHFKVPELFYVTKNDSQVKALYDLFCEHGFITKV